MNLMQRIAAKLFGWQYVVVVWYGDAEVKRVIKVGRYWVLSGTRIIQPSGKVPGRLNTKWGPLTLDMVRLFTSSDSPDKSEEKRDET